jgi:DNA-directed RNA polymerase subunit alpha
LERRQFLLSELVTPKVECIESTESYGRFIAEPLERGFGITLGNALRRVLLSSLLGAAVNWVKVEGIQHEFSAIPHVKEDATEFLLNVKSLRLRPVTGQPGKLFLEIDHEGQVHASDISPSADFEIANPELYLATLDSNEVKLEVEFNVILGRGYVPASHNDGLSIGVIPIDAIFTPVRKVNYLIEPTRIGPHTGYEKLILDVWTDKTISPAEAVTQSAEILEEQFSLFSSFTLVPSEEAEEGAFEQHPSPEQYELPLESLKLPPRVFNCLKRNKISKVGELLEKNEQELLLLKKLGRKSVDEIQEHLNGLGLSLKLEEQEEQSDET